jgi:hypothetical protein
MYAMPLILSTDLLVVPLNDRRDDLRGIVCLLDGLPPLCDYAQDSPAERNLSLKAIA